MLRNWLKTICLLLCAAPCFAQNAQPTNDVQWWPDMQLTWRIKPNFGVVLFGTIRRGQHNDAAITKQRGLGFNWTAHRNFTVASQYRKVINTFTPERRTEEDRLHFDFTPRANLGKGFVVTDRNRIEFRNLNGVFATRYRNRSQIERPLHVTLDGHEHTLTPYFSVEVFYDSRTQAWSRKQIYTGARLPVIEHVTFNGFYMKQWDAVARPGYLHVIGTFLVFDF
ncbi:MAG: DUF2490 domain-containing protein [Acidobacteria bacterium]|nr:DUF2490 domain-containing protein [Acidobacteriota bacterium]